MVSYLRELDDRYAAEQSSYAAGGERKEISGRGRNAPASQARLDDPPVGSQA